MHALTSGRPNAFPQREGLTHAHPQTLSDVDGDGVDEGGKLCAPLVAIIMASQMRHGAAPRTAHGAVIHKKSCSGALLELLLELPVPAPVPVPVRWSVPTDRYRHRYRSGTGAGTGTSSETRHPRRAAATMVPVHVLHTGCILGYDSRPPRVRAPRDYPRRSAQLLCLTSWCNARGECLPADLLDASGPQRPLLRSTVSRRRSL